MKTSKKPLIALLACLLVAALSIGLASGIQTGFGAVKITAWQLETEQGSISYKLYMPPGASAQNPAPAVLVMHGYQNDKDTGAAYGIELARRGIVALSIDEFGHGGATVPMRERGSAPVKVSNHDKPLSGPERYELMMSFSSLDFFRKELSEGLGDTSMGGKAAFAFLQSLDFVQADNIGITGHSMGTWSSWSVAAAFPQHKAVVLQCGEVFPLDYYDSNSIKFNNVLLLQAKYDEFDNFRDYGLKVDGLQNTPVRYHDFMGQDAPVNWNETYGSFGDGSARRMQLLITNHRLTTHDGTAIATAMDWFTTALGVSTPLAANDLVYMGKELLVLLAMLAALAAMLPLLLLLCRIPFFAPVMQPVAMRPESMMSKKSWWKNALIAIAISGATYPFLTQLGHGLFPFPEKVFRMTIGDGMIIWLSFLMLVALVMMLLWYKRGRGKAMGVTLNDLGLSSEAKPRGFDWPVIAKSALAAVILVGAVYVLLVVSVALTGLDFRFIWPFFRPFSGERFGQFLLYLPFYLAFFTLNAGAKLYGQMKTPMRKSPAATQLAWWGRSIFVMLGGLFLVVLIEYIPFFLGIGPGADILFTSTFGGPFMSILILLIPQFMVFFFLSTYLYRRTGRVYVGSFVVAMLACWVVTGGSAMF